MHTLTMISSIAVLLLAVALNQADDGPYRKTSALKAVQDVSPAPHQRTAGPVTDRGAIPPGEPGYEAPKETTKSDSPYKTLDEKGRQLLLRYDDFLFKNLEDAYLHLSYAFKDAARKTQNMCGCDPGSLLPDDDDDDPEAK